MNKTLERLNYWVDSNMEKLYNAFKPKNNPDFNHVTS